MYTIEGNYVPANQMKVWSRGLYTIVTTTDPNIPQANNLYGYGRRNGVYGSSYKSISAK